MCGCDVNMCVRCGGRINQQHKKISFSRKSREAAYTLFIMCHSRTTYRRKNEPTRDDSRPNKQKQHKQRKRQRHITKTTLTSATVVLQGCLSLLLLRIIVDIKSERSRPLDSLLSLVFWKLEKEKGRVLSTDSYQP
jgi:hypothetical protein